VLSRAGSATLACGECGLAAEGEELFCPACAGLMSFTVASPFDAHAWRELLATRRGSNADIDLSGVWRYRELLPPIPLDAVTTLRENAAPLYSGARGAVYAGVEALSYLHLGMNPTASFKDGGMTVAVSHAKARGASVVVCASTGNTAASMAAYSARAGIAGIVLVPAQGVSAAKLAQTLDYGAHVVAIDGDFDRAFTMVRSLDARRIAVVNSVNPYRIEGQKTAAFQLLEQRDWRAPDWLILPGGNLGNTTAFGKGFREALAIGLIDRLPRIAVIQAEGAAPFVPVVLHGGELTPVKAETSATAIKIGAPASWRKALREVLASSGTARSVTDDEIADARAVVGRDGVGCEPASAASLAGLKRLRAEGVVAPGEDVVLVLTGHVLKDGNYAAQYHESGASFANAPQHLGSPEAVARYIESFV
jgi:threonine synthase